MSDKSYKTCAAENAAAKQARKYPSSEPKAAEEPDEIVEEVELQPDDSELEPVDEPETELEAEEAEGE